MSDSFPSNSNKENLYCNVTIINSEFNSEIVNKLSEETEKRLKEKKLFIQDMFSLKLILWVN